MKDTINIQTDPLVIAINIHNLEQEIIATKAKTDFLKGLIEAIKSE